MSYIKLFFQNISRYRGSWLPISLSITPQSKIYLLSRIAQYCKTFCVTLRRLHDTNQLWTYPEACITVIVVLVFITSPSTVYINTSAKSTYYSQNDEDAKRAAQTTDTLEDKVKLIEVLEQKCWLSFRTVLRDGEIEIQDLIAFIGN